MYKIRQAKLADMKFLIEMAQQEGWMPGIYDAEKFFAADNNGFFVGELDNTPIACISAVKHGDYGVIGFYVVKKELRGQGFGTKLWQHAMDYLGDINAGLDGVFEQVENYKKSGFKIAHSNARYCGKFKPTKIDESNIVTADKVNFEDLCKYDTLHFGSVRKNFLKEWINNEKGFSVCYFENETIKGFATCRETSGGFRIGPLFAENKEIAENLLLYLASKIGENDLYLDINEDFKAAVELVEKFQMKKICELKRMYTKAQPQAKWDEVFGITSFELG